MAKRKQDHKQNQAEYVTRDPSPINRDPELTPQRKPRRYIPASMPIVCPDCGGPTRMDDGRHVDPVRQTVLEYRTCARCNAKLAAGRAMVKHEIETHCRGFEAAVREYQDSVR